ncbi:unnamed protein product [Cuscuta campestris]|uniref:Uncharacterized protein n=1 Tax=Cuscuta campestris TaxID=132261 RepID=A0A484L3E5_9ASTE|nr:unnamed protein product [Cuscuta campestris]
MEPVASPEAQPALALEPLSAPGPQPLVIFLEDEKLRLLAEMVRRHETNNLHYLLDFDSPGELNQYIRIINGNLATVHTLLDECKAVVAAHRNDAVLGPIAASLLSYAEHCLNNALQIIRNYTLRRDFLESVEEHLEDLFKRLGELSPWDAVAVAEFTQDLKQYDDTVVSFMWLNINTAASVAFSQHLRLLEITFEDLVRSRQRKLGFTGRFEDLDIDQKLQVYYVIIEESGRLKGVENRSLQPLPFGSKKSKYKSGGMFLFNVGQIVWDIYQRDQPMETVRDVVVSAAEKKGKKLGTILGKAAASAALKGVTKSAIFITAAGVVGGLVGAFIVGAAVGLLFGLIFRTGGQAPLPTDNMIVYVAEMPDGMAFARRIAYS